MENIEPLKKGIKIYNLLEEVIIEFCQNLPFNKTIFEENEECTYPSEICRYCRKERDDAFSGKKPVYYCSKVKKYDSEDF